MAKRRVRGLRWARICERPPGVPIGRPRGPKARGLRYERELAQTLRLAIHGQWFEFEDAEGLGYCQADLLLDRDDFVVCLEAKYTWTSEAREELETLYRPVISMALQRPVIGVVVCKVLTRETTGRICQSLEEAIERRGVGVWHWLGAGGRLSRLSRLRPRLRPLKPIPIDSLLARRIECQRRAS